MLLSVVQDRQILHYGDQAIAIYRGVCLRRSPATIVSVGQDRQILTCLSVGQECLLLPDGDQAIAIYRVCPPRALTLARDRPSLYVKNFCRWGSPDPDMFGWRAGENPRAFFLGELVSLPRQGESSSFHINGIARC